MKISLLLALFFALALKGAANPNRVLYVGTADRTPRMAAHALMRDLGRDAIWFDYVSDPKAATPAFVAKFDVIVLDAPAATFPFLATVPAAKMLKAAALGDAASDGFALTAKPQLLAALATAQFLTIARYQVGDRPDRVEPRAIKRHPKPHRWLRQPRAEARAALCGETTPH